METEELTDLRCKQCNLFLGKASFKATGLIQLYCTRCKKLIKYILPSLQKTDENLKRNTRNQPAGAVRQ